MERVQVAFIPIRRSGLGLYRGIRRELKNFDLSKPMHMVAVGALLATIIAPLTNVLITNERYRLADRYSMLIGKPSPTFKNKLVYDKDKKATVFNAEGQTDVANEAKDLLTSKIGATDKKSTQLYSATLPDKPGTGIVVNDNVNKVKVTFAPLFDTLDGRKADGRVIYPLAGMPGQMVYTPKANGLKEDIILHSAPGDTAEFKYSLVVPDSLAVKLLADGSLGFYSGSPDLFGNISYGTDHDRELVDKARRNAEKNYLMFTIPAPVIKQSGKANPNVSAKFRFAEKTLIVDVKGLKKASYPLTIDPTFVLTTTQDFVLGSIDDNIDLSVAGQVGRQALVGGSTPGWTPNNAPSLTYAQFAAGLVAYNGYLYLIGGGSGNGASNVTTNDVRYISLDSNTGALGTGTPATWTGTQTLLTARQGLQAYGFNGYLYAIGGQDTNGVPLTAANSVEYAKISSTGAIAADSGCGTGWCRGSNLNTVRAYPAGAIYQGVLYVMGGSSGTNNATPVTTVEYARIKGDGTVGAWVQSTSLGTGNLTSARSKFRAGAYNGYVYITGGQTSGTTVINNVEYAAIQPDGSLGAWISLTAFPTARRDHGMVINNGYIYVFAGCSGAAQACAGFIADTQYAQINADGTIGQWQSTVPYNTGGFNSRMPGGVTSYSNHLYFVGGCSAETATNKCATQLVGTFITNIDGVGRFDKGSSSLAGTPYTGTSTVARAWGQAVALNGYMYYISGCSNTTANCGNAYNSIVEYAAINANGTMSNLAATTALPAVTGNKAGRIGHTVVAYKDKIYVIGGLEYTTLNADSYRNDIFSATPASNGTIPAVGNAGTWATETNTLPAAVAFHTSVVWHNYVYVIGGANATTVSSAIYYSQIQSNGTLGAWQTSARTLNNARWMHSIGIWGNWIYVIGGDSTIAGAYITAANATEQLTIGNTGDITTVTTRNITGAFLTRFLSGFVHNGYLYTFGGYTSGSTNAVGTMNWSALDSVTGIPGAWSNTNIGNNAATYGLTIARGAASAVDHGGYFYILGGCTSTMATNVYKSCTAYVTTANTTELYLPNNGGTGSLNTFTSGAGNAVDLQSATGDHAAVAYNGKLYIIGGCTAYSAGVCSANSGAITSNVIEPGGSITNSWTTLTSLPGGEVRSSLRALAYNGFIYVIAGRSASSGATNTVYYTTIDATGALGTTWLNGDLPSGAERRNFGAAISNGFMYVAGGEDAAGTKKNDVYFAQINVDGSLGAWNTTTAFTTARSDFNLIAYNGNLYVIGGSDGTNSLGDVQVAILNANGTVPSWNYVTDVSRLMADRQVVGANGYLYFLGNEALDTEVQYTNINANGTLGMTQTSINKMVNAHAHGAAVFFNGFIYDTGGCTLSAGVCSAPTAVVDKGGQAATSRVGHYSKLFNTQVDTSPTQLVVNGATSGPESLVELKFQTASQANPTLGVAQLIRPVIFGVFYDIQALDPSGVNVGVAFNYFIGLTLDDSRAGTFPDVNRASFAQTAVTDITFYFHANPGRRLRHGASFTSTDCGLTPTFGCTLDTTP